MFLSTPARETRSSRLLELRRARPGAALPGAGEMGGVMAGVDTVGFQARDRAHPDREDPRQVISDLARLVNPTGRLGIASMFTSADAAPAPYGGHADGALHVPWATLFSKGVTVGFGRTTMAGHPRLRDLIVSGRARHGRSSPTTRHWTRPPTCTTASTAASTAS